MTNAFLLEDVPAALRRLREDSKPLWGEMKAKQMVDHLYHSLILGQNPKDWPLRVPEEKLPALKNFLMGPKPFPKMADMPVGFVEEKVSASANLDEALERYLNEIPAFLRTVNKADYRMVHPDFGMLNAEEAIMLSSKHARHHLAQFGLMER